MPNFLKIIISLAVVIAVFYFTSTPSPTTTLVRLGFLAALIGFTLFSLFRQRQRRRRIVGTARHTRRAMRGTLP